MLFIVLCLVLGLLGALLLPLSELFPAAHRTITGVAIAIAVLVLTRATGLVRWDSLNKRFLRSPRLKGALSSLLSVLLLIGALEYCARALTATGVLKYYRPIITVQAAAEKTDWRAHHITQDEAREPDPILFWRSVRRYPYNGQGFKGREPSPVKGPREFRIFCYGDSNTDGPDRGGWPEQLQSVLDQKSIPGGREFLVVNAGVAGYSSYQGLRRFQQEVAPYSPDLVLVSFGWNDHWEALGAPDKQFSSSIPLIDALQGVMLRYRFYLVLKQYMVPCLLRREHFSGPRVSPKEYLENLAGFVETARRHGAAVVLLTRPYGDERILRSDRVPAKYLERIARGNKDLLGFAERERVHALDVNGAFAALPPSLFVDSCHFTLQGHRKMAELLCGYLEDNGLIPAAGKAR